MKVKFLCLLLVICLTVGFIPVVGSAETTATASPTTAPTTKPTTQPSTAPTTKPTTQPSTAPTTKPTTQPSTAPTTKPTTQPSTAPTTEPTTAPTTSGISVSIKLCETNVAEDYLAVLTATKGGKPVYALTNKAGAAILATSDSVPSSNYVKFEYPQNGLPTITLMNAKLRSAGKVLDLSDFDAPVKIVIAGNSTIESTGKYGIYRESYGDITIVGPKKLTMNCRDSAIIFNAGANSNSLTLKNLTLNATTSSNADSFTLQLPSGNLTVDSADVAFVNKAGVAVYLGTGNVNGQGNATISHSVFSATSQNVAFFLDGNLAIADSNVQFTSNSQAAHCVGNLTVNDSTLVMTGRSNAVEAVNVGGEFILRRSNAEITGTNYAIFSNNTLPRVFGEYSVVAGITKDTTTAYSEALISAYQYYYAESLEQPTEPTEPTSTAPTCTDPTCTDPTCTAPTSTAPTCTDPTCTDPTCTAPTSTTPTCTDPTCTDPTCTAPTSVRPICTDPTCTDPTCTVPTESSTVPTLSPTLTPTTESKDTLATTVPIDATPTPPVSNTASGNRTMFWILTALMILGAAGAAFMAISMFRKAAQEDFDELSDATNEKAEEDINQESQERSNEASEIDINQEPQEDISEASEKDIDQESKKFSIQKLIKFLTNILDDDTNA